MTQLIAIDPNALDNLLSEVARLHQRLDGVHMTPPPRWINVAEFAEKIGKSTKTVKRRIDEGKLETKDVAGVRMVLNPDA